jgi:energy-coupling factor transporter ATP-binding protein EcfA2
MLVRSLHVENLLAFDTFDLVLDGKTHVIVGPNGSGKSNVVRIFDLVEKALERASAGSPWPALGPPADQVLRSFAAARHHGEPPQRESVVRLKLEFTTPLERARLAAFVRAAILHTLIEELQSGDTPARVTLTEWADAEIADEALGPLFTGAVVLRHAGMSHVPWEVSYEFTYGGIGYSWLLGGPSVMPGIVRTDSRAAWRGAGGRKRLLDCLFGMSASASQPTQLPDPLPPFDLAALCPGPSEAVTAPVVRTGTGILDQQLPPFRRAIDLLGLPIPEAAPNQTWPLSYAIDMILTDGVVTVGEQFRGLGTGGGPPQQPGPYPWEALASPLRSRAPWMLPLRLFELKNGTPEQRRRYKAIQDTFTALAPGRTCDIGFQAASLETINPAPIGAGQVAVLNPYAHPEQPASAQPGAAITVLIGRTTNGGRHPEDLPVQLHGAGTWEALVIAEALAESEDRFVILDEPAVTLHPTWQRALRSRIPQTAGQFLVITHSADLAPMASVDDLACLVRVENETGATTTHRFPPALLSSDEASRITREFALSTDAVAMLFARGAVLLEGETELGALPDWFAASAKALAIGSPGDLDLCFCSVGGDDNFRHYVAVLHALRIPWVLVCDGAAFDLQKRQKRHQHVFEQVLSAGTDIPELRDFLNQFNTDKAKRIMSQALFDHERKLGSDHGIFTLARGWTTADKTSGTQNDESFEAFIEAQAPGMLAQARAAVGDSKVRQGRWVGRNVPCPPAVRDLYQNLITAFGRRGLTI